MALSQNSFQTRKTGSVWTGELRRFEVLKLRQQDTVGEIGGVATKLHGVGSKGNWCLHGMEGESERKRSSSGVPTVMDGEIDVGGRPAAGL